MNAAEKIAPLVALNAELPKHVHDVRVDEGADGDVWVYVNAAPDPENREPQRYLCFVARDDNDIASERAMYEASLGEWLEQTKVAAAEFGQAEAKRMRARAEAEARSQTEVMFKREMAKLQANDDTRQYDAALLESAVQERAATRATHSAKLKAKAGAGAGAEEEAARAALARKADLDAIAAELRERLEARAQALKEFKATELAKLTEALTSEASAIAAAAEQAESLATSPPPNLTERIEELRSLSGMVVVHQSDHPAGRKTVAPSEARAIVESAAKWMATSVERK